ncbi:hypothetical protein D3C84_812200 [compost metagenome]
MVVAQERRVTCAGQRFQMKWKVEPFAQRTSPVLQSLQGDRQGQLVQPGHLVGNGSVSMNASGNLSPGFGEALCIAHQDEAGVVVRGHHFFGTGGHHAIFGQFQASIGIDSPPVGRLNRNQRHVGRFQRRIEAPERVNIECFDADHVAVEKQCVPGFGSERQRCELVAYGVFLAERILDWQQRNGQAPIQTPGCITQSSPGGIR